MTNFTKAMVAAVVAMSLLLAGCTREANQGAEPPTPVGVGESTTGTV
jgi:nitrous oxide reductase accessory protein NosL